MSTPYEQLPGATSSHVEGLSTEEAAMRLTQSGANAVIEERENGLKKVARHFWAPVPWMLEVTIALQMLAGKRIEALMIGALLIFNVGLSVFQETRAEAALELLKQRLSLKARVKRATVTGPSCPPRFWCRAMWCNCLSASLSQPTPASSRVKYSLTSRWSIPVDAGPANTAYAGAVVRRGEAIASITATGTSTYFGRAAELVRIAHVESTETKVVLGLVRNLSIINAVLVVGLVAYAIAIALPTRQIVSLVLTALLSAVPVALPATFTLAAALGARTVALKGVLLTRLAALHEAATIDVLCADKTGTLTRNELAVATVRPLADGWTPGDVLAFVALTGSTEGKDPVDAAIRAAALATPPQRPLPNVTAFVPFDPTNKRSEATATEGNHQVNISKGAPSALATLAPMTPAVAADLELLSGAGYRTLAIASGPPGKMVFVGLIALNNPPRPDSPPLVAELRSLGVRTVMVTGDAAPTAVATENLVRRDGVR